MFCEKKKNIKLRDKSCEKNNKCDVISSKETTAESSTSYMSWVNKHWHSLICELIFVLGNRLMKAYMRKCGITLKKEDDIQLFKNRFKNIYCPFATWWSQIDREEDISLDKEGKGLIQNLKQELVDDCKIDLVNGWHTLIDCCSLFGNNPQSYVEDTNGTKTKRIKHKDKISNLRKVIGKVIE